MITETLKACPVIPADGFSVSAMKIVESEQSGMRIEADTTFSFFAENMYYGAKSGN